ncbi:hypothetical protein STEG23_009096 [Scotinomys teguina]
MTVTPLGRDQDCSLKNQERMCRLSWFLDPGGWGKAAAVGLYFIFPGICTLSLILFFPMRHRNRVDPDRRGCGEKLKVATFSMAYR